MTSDEHLDAVLIGGREPARIIVVDHDDAWAATYAEVQQRVERALGATALAVHHIGSTSVPGLAAKPIVDVLLVVASVEDEAAYVGPLEQAGLVLRVREPGHRMLRTPERDVHLHVYAAGAPAIADHLDLRDWLRVSAEDRELYAATKRELAQREWAVMDHYADAKTEVVTAVLGRARAWRARTQPSGTITWSCRA